MRDFGAYLTSSAKFCRYIKLFLGWCIEYMQQQCLMCKKIRRYIVILREAKQQHQQQRKMRDFGAYMTPSAKFCRYTKLFFGWYIEYMLQQCLMCKKIRRYIVILRVAKQQHKQQRKMRDFGAYLTPSAKFCRYIKLFLGWCIEYMQQQCLMCKKIRRYIVILRVAKQQHTQQRKMRDFGAYLTPSAKFCRYTKLFFGWYIEYMLQQCLMCKKIRRYIVILRVAKQQHTQQRKMRDFGAYLTPSAKFCRYTKLFFGWYIEYMPQQCIMCKK